MIKTTLNKTYEKGKRGREKRKRRRLRCKKEILWKISILKSFAYNLITVQNAKFLSGKGRNKVSKKRIFFYIKQ